MKNLIENDCHLKCNNSRNETSLKTYTRPRSLNVRSFSPKTITCQCMWIHRDDKSKGTSKLTTIINDKPKVNNLVLFWVSLTRMNNLLISCMCRVKQSHLKHILFSNNHACFVSYSVCWDLPSSNKRSIVAWLGTLICPVLARNNIWVVCRQL